MNKIDYLLALIPATALFVGTGLVAFSLFAIAFGECSPFYAFSTTVGLCGALVGASFYVRQ